MCDDVTVPWRNGKVVLLGESFGGMLAAGVAITVLYIYYASSY